MFASRRKPRRGWKAEFPEVRSYVLPTHFGLSGRSANTTFSLSYERPVYGLTLTTGVPDACFNSALRSLR